MARVEDLRFPGVADVRRAMGEAWAELMDVHPAVRAGPELHSSEVTYILTFSAEADVDGLAAELRRKVRDERGGTVATSASALAVFFPGGAATAGLGVHLLFKRAGPDGDADEAAWRLTGEVAI